MAVLIQRVAGTVYKRFFFPMLAGVAFSRNLVRLEHPYRPSRGAIRLVFGLGNPRGKPGRR